MEEKAEEEGEKEETWDEDWLDFQFADEVEPLIKERTITLAQKLGVLLNNDTLADCAFHISYRGKEVRIPGHRLILAAASPILEAMLYPAFREDDKPDETVREIKVADINPEHFLIMLECIYTDQVLVDAQNVEPLIKIATKYQIEKMLIECARFLEQDVSIENVCELFEIAPRLLGIKEFGLNFIENNTEEVVKSPGFLTLSKERMAVILQNPKLCITEDALFDALIWWAKAKIKQDRKEEKESSAVDTTQLQIKSMIHDLLPLIRFPLMSLHKIASTVAPSRLLDEDAMLALWRYVSVTDEAVKSKIKVPFFTDFRAGPPTLVITWDPLQSFTQNLYTVSNQGRTALKSQRPGTIYILRATRPIENKGASRVYWELFLDHVPESPGDIHLGMAPTHFTWTSAWLNSSGSYYINARGQLMMGSVQRFPGTGPLATGDRIGFTLDMKKRTFEITRGRGRSGGPMTSSGVFTEVTGMYMTSSGVFTDITGVWYPCIAARTVGFMATAL